MHVRLLLLALCLSGLWLSGCGATGGGDTGKYVYFVRPPGRRVGVRETCPRYYDPPRSGYKITLPSVGYGGATVNLGSYEIDPAQLQNVSDLLTLIDQGRWNTCCSVRDAAEAGDWARYDRLTAIEDDNTAKITQIEIIFASHAAAQKGAGEGPEKEKARAALITATSKWTEAYGDAGQHMVGVQARTVARTASLMKDVNRAGPGMMGTSAATPTPAGTPAPSLSKSVAAALAVPAKPNGFFGLPPAPAKPNAAR